MVVLGGRGGRAGKFERDGGDGELGRGDLEMVHDFLALRGPEQADRVGGSVVRKRGDESVGGVFGGDGCSPSGGVLFLAVVDGFGRRRGGFGRQCGGGGGFEFSLASDRRVDAVDYAKEEGKESES